MRRTCFGLLLALLLAVQSGCCCLSCLDWGHGPAGPLWTRTWCGPQCGEIFWSEWFSIPPLCDDPCNDCGDFTCSNNPYVLSGPTEWEYGPIYDDGVRAHGAARQTSSPHRSGSPAKSAPRNTPTPAKAPESEVSPDAPPVEELPSMEPTTSTRQNEFEHTVSQPEPVDSQIAMRKVRKLRR